MVVDENLSGNDEGSDMVIPSVPLKEEVSDLKARIWCEWLGGKCSNDDDKVEVLDHDFGAVTFAYDYELGKSGLFDDMKLSLSSSAAALTENDEGAYGHQIYIKQHSKARGKKAAEKMCDICQQKMLPEKDVAMLWNRKTGKLPEKDVTCMG
ncbi:hypothetical protein OIU77_004810 [Salix suchowensis]|uniref:Uncharacterized protein n=1 Tax=Salix suchowensis TaxID=1278906 RepID=A0ABQ9AXQ0_9ROSI|nr:hypothetical protein OIU77_004810 [Salix suchowensis]